MTTIELKNKVISKINQLNDDEILEEVYKILYSNFDDNEIYQLSDNHIIAIEKAKAQIERGEYITNEKANKEIDEWLNK